MAFSARCFNGSTFVFNGKSSDMYGLYMGWRDHQEELETGLQREVVKTEMNMLRHIPNHYGVKYNDVLSLEFEIFHQDKSPFDYRESRSINNWLMQDSYKRFKVNDNNVDNIFYNVICTSIQDIVIGDFCGKAVTMVCDSPFGYTMERIKTLDTLEAGNGKIKINNTSDDGIYYPKIEIRCTADYSGTVELKNITEDKKMVLDMAGITAAENMKLIHMDTSRMMLLDYNNYPIPLYKVGWNITEDPTKAVQTTELYWLRLVSGINEIEIMGNAKVSFTMSFPRKAGQLNEERLISM